ncbi:MAG: PepSY domain-containing protein [Cyanobacteria bacterium J06627_3]
MFEKQWFKLGLISLAVLNITACIEEEIPDISLESVPQAEFKVTFPEALAIAEAMVDGKQAYSMELEKEDGQPVIEVGIDGQEIFVHAVTGEIVSIDDLRGTDDQEDLEEITEFLQLQSLATVPILEALQTGEAFAGEQAHTVELENEDGNLVYEVVVGRQEIYVDAGTGQVLYTEGGAGGNETEQASSIQVPGDDNDDDE